MMLEKDASPGTKLHACIASCLLRERFVTSLARMKEQSSEWWGRMAMILMDGLSEVVAEQITKEDEGSHD